MDLADLLKQATSPAPQALPTARRMTIDSAALAGLIDAIENGSSSADTSLISSDIDGSSSPALKAAATVGRRRDD
jgi:hypothetical protein